MNLPEKKYEVRKVKLLSKAPPNSTSIRDFQNFLTYSGLLDIGFVGSPFTWAKNSSGISYVAATLDRALINSTSIDAFQDPHLSHLPRQASW